MHKYIDDIFVYTARFSRPKMNLHIDVKNESCRHPVPGWVITQSRWYNNIE